MSLSVSYIYYHTFTLFNFGTYKSLHSPIHTSRNVGTNLLSSS